MDNGILLILKIGTKVLIKKDNFLSQSHAETIYNFAYNSSYKIGWEDSPDLSARQYPSLHSIVSLKDLSDLGLIKALLDFTAQTKFNIFKQSNFTKAVINLSKPSDVHYTHTHSNALVALYYINLSWKDEYAGETLFYSNEDEVIYTSKYKPRKLVCFDGAIPHALRPQSIIGPNYRFTLSMFFKKE